MSNKKEKEEEKPIVAKTAVDLQRLKLMKLMKNPVSIYLHIIICIALCILMISNNIYVSLLVRTNPLYYQNDLSLKIRQRCQNLFGM